LYHLLFPFRQRWFAYDGLPCQIPMLHAPLQALPDSIPRPGTFLVETRQIPHKPGLWRQRLMICKGAMHRV
jgi:hypothetical protein